MTVCERIDAILQERGISRRKLAIKAGIAPSSFQSAMARNRSLSLDMLIPISDVLGISVEYLDTGIDDHHPYTDGELQSIYNLTLSEPKNSDLFGKAVNLLLKLNDAGQQKVIERIEELLELQKYRSDRREIGNGVLQDHD